jgi:predicted RNase H-like nuclease (RuvC/YqgF family)
MTDEKKPANIARGRELWVAAAYSGSHSAGLDAVEWLKDNANPMFDELEELREELRVLKRKHANTKTELHSAKIRAGKDVTLIHGLQDRITRLRKKCVTSSKMLFDLVRKVPDMDDDTVRIEVAGAAGGIALALGEEGTD